MRVNIATKFRLTLLFEGGCLYNAGGIPPGMAALGRGPLWSRDIFAHYRHG